jgi:hypothetical protein
MSVGLVVHGGSPQPGHGPGVTVIATGPGSAFAVRADAAGHRGLTEAAVASVASAAGASAAWPEAAGAGAGA